MAFVFLFVSLGAFSGHVKSSMMETDKIGFHPGTWSLC